MTDLVEWFKDLRADMNALRRNSSKPTRVARKKNKLARAHRRITRVRDRG